MRCFQLLTTNIFNLSHNIGSTLSKKREQTIYEEEGKPNLPFINKLAYSNPLINIVSVKMKEE